MQSVIRPDKLELFFARLQERFGTVLVLRGYQYLPTGYTNDIDVYIPKCNLGEFLNCISELDDLDITLTILVSRLGLIKCNLTLEGEDIPFDVLYGFYYFGLEYQDCESLTQRAIRSDCGLFSTPNLSDEIRISILKELLHNKRVRADKADYLGSMIDLCSAELVTEYFDIDSVRVVRHAIERGKLYLPSLSQRLRLLLFTHNLCRSPVKTLRNIALFALVKYVYKNRYHRKLMK
jgi:hypothetical protein